MYKYKLMNTYTYINIYIPIWDIQKEEKKNNEYTIAINIQREYSHKCFEIYIYFYISKQRFPNWFKTC